MVWNVLMAVYLAFALVAIADAGGEEAWIAIIGPPIVWFWGMVVLGIVWFVRAIRRPSRTSGSRNRVYQRGTTLYQRGRSKRQGAYECRSCGATTSGFTAENPPGPDRLD